MPTRSPADTPVVTVDAAAEPPPYRTQLIRLGRRRVLISRPNPVRYGHLAIEVLYSLAYARLLDVPVCFVRPRRGTVNDAVFEVDADGVRILRSRLERFLPRLAAAAAGLRARRSRSASLLRRETQLELKRYLDAHRLPKFVRADLKRAKDSAAERRKPTSWTALSRESGEAYNRRRLIAEPLTTRFTARAEHRAIELATALGIDRKRPIVTVHCRERGYKLGAEMQDAKSDGWDDTVRNANIDTHFAAMDFLARRGFAVVRIGDPTMTPVRREGVVDLATSPARDPLLELWCLDRSRFLLCAESGPLGASYLMSTPLLTVNATDPIGAFPVRPDGIYLLKTIIDRRTGRRLAPQELLSEDHLHDLRNPARHEFLENSSAQILEAVQEMLELLERGTPESPAQERFRRLVVDAAAARTHLDYVRKHGPDRGYMGSGRLARTLAETWMADAPAPGRAAAAAASY